MRYIVSGVALSGNKGASGMTEALIQNLSEADKDAFFYIFSYYPKADRPLLAYANAAILDGSPKNVVLLFFAVIIYRLGRLVRLPAKYCCWSRTLGAIARCDRWLDASGISFVDGREKFLIFNVLSIFPALALKIPVIKVAQAMGPFEHKLNYWTAKAVLPRISWIIARGKVTADYLQTLQLTNVSEYSDVAFSLKTTDRDRAFAAQAFMAGDRTVIGISPSQVVWKLCESKNIDYLGVLAACVRQLLADGCHCVVFPHSIRPDTDKTHNNDLPLLKRFTAMLPESEHLTVLSGDMQAGELRELIGRCDLLVASRFHAIISAMAMKVPAVVIGWSHKYAEVLAPFELDDFVIGYHELKEPFLLQKIRDALSRRAELSSSIAAHSRQIIDDNSRFFQSVVVKSYGRD